MFRHCGHPPAAGHFRTPVGWIFDRVDERRARRLRCRLGQRRWLLSWQQQSDGRWLARLSCPALVVTLERAGRTRTAAIAHAVRTLNSILALRSLLDRGSPGLTDDSKGADDRGS
jgi:hypothetical protein